MSEKRWGLFGRGRPTEEADPVARDRDLAWELFEAQPTNPEVARLAARVLAQEPWRDGIRILLAMHRSACGAADEAREILHGVIGQRNRWFGDAARVLRDLERGEADFDEARRWAEEVLREDQESWRDWMELGGLTALSGDVESGWQLLDSAATHCARTDADNLRHALARRASYLLESFAPPERFVPAAEAAIRANPANELIGVLLIWAFLPQGRFDDAEELALRLLRLNPTDEGPAIALEMIRALRSTLEKADQTFEDLHRTGLLHQLWAQQRDERLGLDLPSALAALDEVMPAELRATLRPPLDPEAAQAGPGEAAIAGWHDGQSPGEGSLWGLPGDFRLMSAAEIQAMDDAIEADPEKFPQWRDDDLSDYYSQVMTDDAGGYLIELADGRVVIRRPDGDDEPVAPSLADLFWERVAAFGGRNRRPAPRKPAAGNSDAAPRDDRAVDGAEPAGDSLEPRTEVLAELDRLNDACLAAPGDIDPQIKLWQAVTALDHWVCINRGTVEEPRPYALAADDGAMLCIFSSTTRAKASAHASGLVPEGDPVPLFVVPLPEALRWAMSFGERGVVGVTIDHPQLGAWCPLPNLARLGQMRAQS